MSASSVPLSHLHSIRVIVAEKLKIKYQEVRVLRSCRPIEEYSSHTTMFRRNPTVSYLSCVRVCVYVHAACSASQVPTDKSVRALCGGKSALQNEILGDIAAEFKTEADGNNLPIPTPLARAWQTLAFAHSRRTTFTYFLRTRLRCASGCVLLCLWTCGRVPWQVLTS